MDKIKRFVDIIALRLSIPSPSVSYDTSMFETDTMLAMCEPATNTIHLKSNKNELDTMFATAHEMRHLWQQKTDPEKYFTGRKSRTEADIEEYNTSLSEVDVNAFAYVIMTRVVGRTPLFNGLSASAKNAIYDRAKDMI